MIFFSAHGVPLAYVEEAGDPYKAEMEECVDLIMEELETRKIRNPFTLAYQVIFFSAFDSAVVSFSITFLSLDVIH
jgi:protoheme ferro-lyase